jgi:hypothetical protein
MGMDFYRDERYCRYSTVQSFMVGGGHVTGTYDMICFYYSVMVSRWRGVGLRGSFQVFGSPAGGAGRSIPRVG